MSHRFEDNDGREWIVAINILTIKRVRDLVGFDLLDVDDGQMFDRLRADPILLVNVIYAICKDQADEQGISDESFGKAMAGDAIEHATEATLRAIVSFTPNPRDRVRLERVLDLSDKAMNKVRDKIDLEIESIDIEKIVEEAVSAKDGASSTSSPESSE